LKGRRFEHHLFYGYPFFWTTLYNCVLYYSLYEHQNTCNAEVVVRAVLLQSSYYSKLEKADILEMTVKYLNSLRRQRVAGKLLFYDVVTVSLACMCAWRCWRPWQVWNLVYKVTQKFLKGIEISLNRTENHSMAFGIFCQI